MTSEIRQSSVPPLGEWNHTSRVCSRLLGYSEAGEQLCGQPATQHVIYWWRELPEGGNPDDFWDHGFCCGPHWTEYQERWSYAFAHPLDAPCGMPGSRFISEENRCTDEDLPTVEPVRAIAAVVVA